LFLSFSNNSSLSQARLNQLLLGPYLKTEDDYNSSPEPPSPSLDLLHKFQRLLLSHIHQSLAEDLAGAESVLATYLQHIVTFCAATLTKAHEVVQQGKVGVADVLKSDISGNLDQAKQTAKKTRNTEQKGRKLIR
jgi:E3 ubiquitin-protein ligase HERC2